MTMGVSFDILEQNRSKAPSLTKFLYKQGQGNKGFREDIELEECLELLKVIERMMYDQYDYVIRGGNTEINKNKISGEILHKNIKCYSCNLKWQTHGDYKLSNCPRCGSYDCKDYPMKYGNVEVEFWVGDNLISTRSYPHKIQEEEIDREFREFLEYEIDDIRSESRWELKKGDV